MQVPPEAIQRREDWHFSALLIGPGDARHLYTTLIDLGQQVGKPSPAAQKKQNKKKKATASGSGPSTHGPKIHFTLVSHILSPDEGCLLISCFIED